MNYSQYNQDLILDEKIFKGFKNGFFVDVGAHDGKTINNTLYFEEKYDWTGINIEPLPNVFEQLKNNRTKCTNINVAIDFKDGMADFTQNKGYTEMLSGLTSHYEPRHLERLIRENKEHSCESEIIKVKTRRLHNILEEYKIDRIHYLTIEC